MPRNTTTAFLGAAALAALMLVTTACSTPKGPAAPPSESGPPPVFPPETVLRDGDYADFLARNEEALKTCADPEHCAAALFNLSFLHCYSKSPYYDPPRALLYLGDLIKGAPESPWAYQARVWVDLMRRTAARPDGRKRPAREEPRAKEETAPEPPRQTEVPQDAGFEADRQRLREEIRSRDERINELNHKLERARQIDIEIDRKERGLFYEGHHE